MGSWASWRNTGANHNYNLYNMVCASVHFSGTFVASTNFSCTRQRVLSRQKLPNLYQVFPSVFGEDTHDRIYCRAAGVEKPKNRETAVEVQAPSRPVADLLCSN